MCNIVTSRQTQQTVATNGNVLGKQLRIDKVSYRLLISSMRLSHRRNNKQTKPYSTNSIAIAVQRFRATFTWHVIKTVHLFRTKTRLIFVERHDKSVLDYIQQWHDYKFLLSVRDHMLIIALVSNRYYLHIYKWCFSSNQMLLQCDLFDRIKKSHRFTIFTIRHFLSLTIGHRSYFQS